MDYTQLILNTLGGTVAITAGLWVSTKIFLQNQLAKGLAAHQAQLNEKLEATKANLARDNAIATARIEQLRLLWEATYQYGGAVHTCHTGLDRNDPELAEKIEGMNSKIENFNKAIASSGVFMGYKRHEQMLQSIGDSFREKLAKTTDRKESQRLFDDFQHNRLLKSLEEIQEMLYADARKPS